MPSERDLNQDPNQGKPKFNLIEMIKKKLKKARPKKKKKRRNNIPDVDNKSVNTQLSGRVESVPGYETAEPDHRATVNNDVELMRSPNNMDQLREGTIFKRGNREIFVEKFELNPKPKKESETNSQKLDKLSDENTGHTILDELERSPSEQMDKTSEADMNTMDRIQQERSFDLGSLAKESNVTSKSKKTSNRSVKTQSTPKTPKGTRISF